MKRNSIIIYFHINFNRFVFEIVTSSLFVGSATDTVSPQGVFVGRLKKGRCYT